MDREQMLNLMSPSPEESIEEPLIQARGLYHHSPTTPKKHQFKAVCIHDGGLVMRQELLELCSSKLEVHVLLVPPPSSHFLVHPHRAILHTVMSSATYDTIMDKHPGKRSSDLVIREDPSAHSHWMFMT